MEIQFKAIQELLQDYSYGLPLCVISGLLFGSFATMASYRLPHGEDWVFKPSHCTSCSHRLGLLDLFPIFSWLSARGKCRHCHAKISARYPLTEALTAILFTVVYIKFGISLTAIAMALLVVSLVIMIVTDLEYRIIPDEIQIAIVLSGIIYRYALDSDIEQYFSGSMLGLCVALFLRYGFYMWKKREGLGMGDVKFFAASGIFLGIKAFLPFLFFSGVFGIIFSLIWKKIHNEEEFPFGPALAFSMLLCLIYPEYSVKYFYYYE
jgi:prepilin signal peptidase PulO-like enzyme (type II secretory pathway)